jgi:hypothetical protein
MLPSTATSGAPWGSNAAGAGAFRNRSTTHQRTGAADARQRRGQALRRALDGKTEDFLPWSNLDELRA